MKVWYGYGSEHSSNLVMIGHFTDANKAQKVKEILDSLAEQYNKDSRADSVMTSNHPEKFSDDMLKLLQEVHVYNVAPHEFEQFTSDIRVEVKGDAIIIKTDEIDVSAYLKVFIDLGARIEVYSAHDHPEDDKKLRQ